MSEPTLSHQDTFIDKHQMHPFWIFSDPKARDAVGGRFLCFVGAHYPPGLVATEKDPYNYAVATLKDGRWKTEMLAEAKSLGNEKKKIGWGYGDVPLEAFRKAMYSAGYLKVKDTT